MALSTPMQTCLGPCGLDLLQSRFATKAGGGRDVICRACRRELRGVPAEHLPRVAATPKAATVKPSGDYIQPAEVLATWAAVQKMSRAGMPAPNMVFLGPSGSGKSASARDLAERAGLAFTKVDAPSMTDPEAWFGTREIISQDGVPVTVYHESEFVRALRSPGLLLIDEFNRVTDAVRQILLPAFDDSRAVTNPITGETVVRHPECFVVMTGNVGLAFTGTYAVDPSLMTRALVSLFDYLAPEQETALVMGRTGVDEETARTFVRWASESRDVARQDEDFPPISTREVLAACALVAVGLPPRAAAYQAVINGSSADGGAESHRARLEMLWTGVNKPAD